MMFHAEDFQEFFQMSMGFAFFPFKIKGSFFLSIN
jgi:hypothetical protein